MITGKSWNLQVTVTAATAFSVSPFSISSSLDESSCSRLLEGMLWIRGLQCRHLQSALKMLLHMSLLKCLVKPHEKFVN